MARVFDLTITHNPFMFPLAISLQFNKILYIKNIMKVVREKLIECSIVVKELFENTEDALTENKQGKIISVDIINTKFIRNNIKLFDDTTTSSSNNQEQKSKNSELGIGI
jgi:hypothetical protein